MKLVYILPVLLVLVIGVSQAEAYEGTIRAGAGSGVQHVQGDMVPFSGHIIKVEPIPDEKIQIIFVERSTGNTIFTAETVIDFPSKFEGDDEYWTFEYTMDTADTMLTTRTVYDVIFRYDDKDFIDNFVFYPPPAEMNIIIANSESFATQDVIIEEEIPSWVKDIFRFYSNGEISDKELLNALQYLISVNILNP